MNKTKKHKLTREQRLVRIKVQFKIIQQLIEMVE